ncbi:hypothetical protein JYT23_01040 [Mariprofundus ferrooxydans]|nr:hypothetical protein [Mariprofundus ferrooxydans]
MADTFYNWEQIKVEYESGKALNAIRRDHGCNRATIRKHAAKDGWLRPELPLVDMVSILSKATHEELLEFSLVYQKCHENRMKGRDYHGFAGFKGAQPFCQMSLARSCKGLLWLFGEINHESFQANKESKRYRGKCCHLICASKVLALS